MDELCRRQVRLGGAELLAAVDTKHGHVLASLMMREADGVAFVCDVGTAPTERRRGLASALISAGVALARARGASLVGLTARRDDAPRRLYERLGFVSVGESVDFVRGV